jgi:hypothetical protein
MLVYERVSRSFRTESITKYTLTTISTSWEAKQRVMEAKLTRVTHKIGIQLHLVAESCTICSSRSRRPVRKILDTPTYNIRHNITITKSRIFRRSSDASFQDPVISVAGVATTSQLRACAMLSLVRIGNGNICGWGGLQWRNDPNKFRESWWVICSS